MGPSMSDQPPEVFRSLREPCLFRVSTPTDRQKAFKPSLDGGLTINRQESGSDSITSSFARLYGNQSLCLLSPFIKRNKTQIARLFTTAQVFSDLAVRKFVGSARCDPFHTRYWDADFQILTASNTVDQGVDCDPASPRVFRLWTLWTLLFTGAIKK